MICLESCLLQQIDTKSSCVFFYKYISTGSIPAMKDTKLGRTHASRSCYGWDRWVKCLLFCCWFRDFLPFFLMCVFFFAWKQITATCTNKTLHAHQSAWFQDEISFLLPGAKSLEFFSKSPLRCVLGVFWKGMTTPVDERLGKGLQVFFLTVGHDVTYHVDP